MQKDWHLLCRFRTTNHRLPIEAGRWQNLPREDRLCPLYNENIIGDEYHHIMRCSYFDNERKICIDRKYLTNCNIEKFKSVMNKTRKSKLRKLCSFIRAITDKVNSLP